MLSVHSSNILLLDGLGVAVIARRVLLDELLGALDSVITVTLNLGRRVALADD